MVLFHTDRDQKLTKPHSIDGVNVRGVESYILLIGLNGFSFCRRQPAKCSKTRNALSLQFHIYTFILQIYSYVYKYRKLSLLQLLIIAVCHERERLETIHKSFRRRQYNGTVYRGKKEQKAFMYEYEKIYKDILFKIKEIYVQNSYIMTCT